MGSECSSQNQNKTGGGWTAQIYFDPEAHVSTGDDHRISDSELRTELAGLISTEEEIQNIWVYSHKLYEWQIMQGLMYHAFVVLETESHYWSIEKNDEGITIQRSTKLAFVKSKYRRADRNTPITVINSDRGRMKMEDLIEWLYQQDELNKKYSWDQQSRNCQGFAKRIFDQFAAKKYCSLPVVKF